MRFIIIFITLILMLNADTNIEITQNMKALYKGVEITKAQEDYIFDNQEIIRRILKQKLKNEIKYFKEIDEKNVVRFIITPTGEISDFSFLKTSGNKKLDRATKKAINKANKKFPRPKEKTEIRYIISYRVGHKQIYSNYSNEPTNNSKETYYQTISRGTTRFQHTSKEYVRVLKTNADGFIDASTSPIMCADLKLLTIDNQYVSVGYSKWRFNAEIPKGTYKLLIKTKKTCDVNLQYK